MLSKASRSTSRSGTEVREVRANGLRFAYFEEGRGPLVLLLHGFPDTPHTWDHVRPALAQSGFRAVSPYLRGYVPTEIPQEEAYDADTLGRDALGLIEALGEERAVVVGHDFGASAAYSAAGLAPERLRLLITVAVPHPASIFPTPRFLWAARHFFSLRRRGAARWIRAGGLAHIDTLVHRWSPQWEPSEDALAPAKETLGAPGCLEAALGYYRALRPRLPASQRRKVQVPSVAFAGATDVLPTAAYERARSRYAGAYEVIVLPGGHFLHREHPERFASELLRVLAPYREGGTAPG
jgi:pimeloyl-ACP methyl ester carboxylesterase